MMRKIFFLKSGTVNNRYKWLRLALIYWGVCAIVVGTASYALGQEADGTNCPSGVSGLCTPGVFESATETVTETTETSGTGTTTTTTTTTETTTTTAAVPVVISDINLAADSIITIDVDQLDSGGVAAGLKIALIGKSV